MFGHDTKGGLFINQADVGSKNPDNSDALLFSKLGQLENCRNYDGTFKFKLCYPELTWGVNKEKCNEWIQSSNPLTESTITGFVAISLAFTKNGDLRDWKGLGKLLPSFQQLLMMLLKQVSDGFHLLEQHSSIQVKDSFQAPVMCMMLTLEK